MRYALLHLRPQNRLQLTSSFGVSWWLEASWKLASQVDNLLFVLVSWSTAVSSPVEAMEVT